MDERDRIIFWIANLECQRVARRVARDLQGVSEGMQSGEDSPLANLWDEVCVQVQDQESTMWEYYLDLMRGMIQRQVQPLDLELRKAIWLQTDSGRDWAFHYDWQIREGVPPEPDGIPYSEDDTVDYILRDYILKIAADWTNRRISKYLAEGIDFN
jgi:hypothetical protein